MELLVGCVAGFSIGATGVGGGLVAAPLLILLLGVPADIAIATAMLFLAGARLHAGFLYYRRGNIAWTPLAVLLLGGIPGALAGPWLVRRITANTRPGLLLLAIGLIVAASASLSLLSALIRPGKPGAPRPQFLAWTGLVIGTALGFSSAGAGTLGALALLHFTDLEPASVVGTDIVAGLALWLAAGVVYLAVGSVSAPLLWKLALGGVPGVLAGVIVGTHVRVAGLRTAISAWALVLGSILAGQGLRSCLS